MAVIETTLTKKEATGDPAFHHAHLVQPKNQASSRRFIDRKSECQLTPRLARGWAKHSTVGVRLKITPLVVIERWSWW
jgi:hypothetical protein